MMYSIYKVTCILCCISRHACHYAKLHKIKCRSNSNVMLNIYVCHTFLDQCNGKYDMVYPSHWLVNVLGACLKHRSNSNLASELFSVACFAYGILVLAGS